MMESNASDWLKQSVMNLNRVGSQMAERLSRLQIYTLQDLLLHFPSRYQDRTRISPIGSVRLGDQVVIEGYIDVAELKIRKKTSLLCQMSDGTGSIVLRFFHFTARQRGSLVRGAKIRCFGEVRKGPYQLEMVHPEYTLLYEQSSVDVEESLTPIYPLSEGLHQKTLRQLTDQVLALMAQLPVDEYLPESLLKRLNFPSFCHAVGFLHRPSPDACLADLEEKKHPSHKRLAFEELLAHQLSLRLLRKELKKYRARPCHVSPEDINDFLLTLPFDLTYAQKRVIAEIWQDLVQPHPMMRLVQGDVGSGKTIVAACAALYAIKSGCQVALMAPTEILAEQHLRTFQLWFKPLNIEVAWLAGRQKVKQRKHSLEKIASGVAQFVVGTHALFQEDVSFACLGMTIIDEQHRFGVHQRSALRDKGVKQNCYPHQLIMTATPIPRTLAMTAYADLDYSVIDELPKGRTPITTIAIPDTRREDVIERVYNACKKGSQAYWVCTLIEESEVLQCQAAEDTAALLRRLLPELNIALVHGRMRPEEKDKVMHTFKEGDADLLVATTVIEVGVDVPKASLMIIENAERFGLAQLHQLRGRVGRGAEKSHCVLMYRAPLSEISHKRLATLRHTTDGFEIAQHDLAIRGPGELLGTKQTGMLMFRVADLVRDQDLLAEVKKTAEILVQTDPDYCQLVIERWLRQPKLEQA